jgi:hypothetical protein
MPTGSGVLIKLEQEGIIADPKVLIRRHVRLFLVVLHSAANESAAAVSVLPDRQRGDTLQSSGHLRTRAHRLQARPVVVQGGERM